MAGRDRGVDLGRGARRADDVREDRDDAGVVFEQAKIQRVVMERYRLLGPKQTSF